MLNKIEEKVIRVANRVVNISSTGIWVDTLNEDGTVKDSVASAWEELSEREAQSYMSLYEALEGGSQVVADLEMTG